MATRNSSARSSSTPSAVAGSRRTSVSAVLSVLNRKCGRMRDCSSASRAVVSAGTRGLGAQPQPLRTWWRRSPRRPAPGRGRSAPTGRRADGIDEQGRDERRREPARDRAEADRREPLQPPPVPRASGRLSGAQRQQPDQHARQGDARAGGGERRARRRTSARAKTMPIAITPCTNSRARSTTPTWQTSNAESGAGAARRRGIGRHVEAWSRRSRSNARRPAAGNGAASGRQPRSGVADRIAAKVGRHAWRALSLNRRPSCAPVPAPIAALV